MMAAGSSMFPTWFAVFVLLSLLISVRTESQPCVDGMYEHAGRNCCLCGAGLHVEEHCTTNLQPGKCKPCASDTYSSHPNSQESCEPCTSCSQPNANLEVDERCTSAEDAKCRCKKGHYCSSGTETCKICYPCKECGDVGIKIHCTAKNNTVCNDKIKGGDKTGMIVGIVVLVIALVFLGVLAFLYRKRCMRYWKRKYTPEQPSNGNGNDEEMQPLGAPVVNLQLHLPDVAEAIGWRDMRDVALRTGVPSTTIESCELNHPRNTQEQTQELLQIWVERKGKRASKILIENLQNNGKRGKADSVREILTGTNCPA